MYSDDGIEVSWPVTPSGKISFSTPYCLDADKNPVIKTCCNGIWGAITSRECAFYAYKVGNVCPPRYRDIFVGNKTLCIHLSAASEWQEDACFSSGTEKSWPHLAPAVQTSLLKYLRQQGIAGVWLPARRRDKVRWSLVGNRWRHKVEVKFSDMGGDCLKLRINGSLELRNCKDKLPHLCVYDHDRLIQVPGGWTTRYSPQQSYFWIEKSQNLTNPFEVMDVSSVESLHIYSSLAANYSLAVTDQCLVYGPKHSQFVLSGSGKLKNDSSFNCIVRQKALTNSRPNLMLRFDKVNFTLTLVVFSNESLWSTVCLESAKALSFKCFTNSTDDELKIVKSTMIGNRTYTGLNSTQKFTKTTYQLEILRDAPSQYWCEGFFFPNITLIKSEVVIAYRKLGLTYAVVARTTDVRKLAKDFIKTLNGHGLLSVSRLISTHNSTDGLFHITVFNYTNGTDAQLPAHVADYYATKLVLEEILKNRTTFSLISIKSTEFCLPALTWTYAKIGGRSLSRQLCLLPDGLPLSCKCIGDFLTGGSWETLDMQNIKCREDVPEITRTLSKVESLTAGDAVVLMRNMSDMTSDDTKVIASDIYFLSRTLQKISQLKSDEKAKQSNEDLLVVVNNLMEANTTIVQEAQQKLNSTNMVLAAYDEISSHAHLNETLTNMTNVIQLVVDPLNSEGVSGLAWFADDHVEKLNANDTVDRLMTLGDLEVATFVPQSLLKHIKAVKIVITIFKKSILFEKPQTLLQPAVVSVTIPDTDTDLTEMLPIIFKTSGKPSGEYCTYYAYSDETPWKNYGCTLLKSTSRHVACGCTHLTYFSYSMINHMSEDVRGPRTIEHKRHAETLNLITIIGGSLSLFGIFGIIITALVFKTWREKTGTKVLLHLSAAIALEMVLIAFVNTEAISKQWLALGDIDLCKALGAIQHYSILVVFTWMLITAYLQFLRYVKVLGETRPENLLVKGTLIGWGLPLIPIGIVLLVKSDLYVPQNAEDLCFPRENAWLYALILPIGLIFAGNLFVYLCVIQSIFKIPELNMRTNERNMIVAQLRLSINLFFLLGLTWIFGLGTAFTRGTTSIVCSYLFCLTATLQGFVLFVYFIVMDPVTRKFWKLVLANLGINCSSGCHRNSNST